MLGYQLNYAGFKGWSGLSPWIQDLSEPPDDGTPGSKTSVNTDRLHALHHEITSQGYRYSRPEITTAPWGDRVFEVIDPFSNKILFNERASQ